MSTPLPTDKLLTQRGTKLYAASADMSTIQPTDLLLVARGGVNYKCLASDFRTSPDTPPDIGSVTLTNPVGGTSRFTGRSFPVSFNMLDNGQPPSVKKLKAHVDGVLKNFPKSSAITAVYSIGHTTLTFADSSGLDQFDVGDAIKQENSARSTPTTLDPSDHTGTLSNGNLSFRGTYARSVDVVGPGRKIQFEMRVDTGPTGSGCLIGFSEAGSDGNPGPTLVGVVYDSAGLIRGTGTWSSPLASGLAKFGASDVVGAIIDSSNGRVEFFKNGVSVWSGTVANPDKIKLFVHASQYESPSVSVTANFGATAFAHPVAGYGAFTLISPIGTVGSIDATAKTMTLASSTGTWDVGSSVRGPSKTIMHLPETDVITHMDVRDYRTGILQDRGGGSTFFNRTNPTRQISVNGNHQGNQSGFRWRNPYGSHDKLVTISVHVESFGNNERQVYVTVNGQTQGKVNQGAADMSFSNVPEDSLIEFYYGSADGNDSSVMKNLRFDGKELFNHTKLTFASSKELNYFEYLDQVTEGGNGRDGKGTICLLYPNENAFGVDTLSGTWDIGSVAYNAVKKASVSARLYAVLDSNGAVSDMSISDPGFSNWNTYSVNPYSGSLTFPALLPTGNTPDVDFPAGTSVTVEVQASNAHSSDTAKSNTVTPV